MGRMKEKMMRDKELTYAEHLEAYSHGDVVPTEEYNGTGNPQEAAAKQIGGNHYANMVITPTEYILLNNIEWLEGNAIKYISRHENKNGKEDILKAIHYCELIIKEKYA